VLGVRQIRGQWGVIMSRINGQNFTRALSGGQGPTPYLEEMARLHVAIHRHRAPGLPSLKAWLGDEIQQAEANLGAALQSVLDRLAEMPHSDRLCHGDFQPSNVMGKPGNAWIIDWPHAAQGDPAIDVCQSWLLMQRSEKEVATAYVEAYAKESGREPDDVLRWAPIVASARLGNVPSEADSLTPIVFEGLSR
jgi:thiamine kinase-like enzyme